MHSEYRPAPFCFQSPSVGRSPGAYLPSISFSMLASNTRWLLNALRGGTCSNESFPSVPQMQHTPCLSVAIRRHVLAEFVRRNLPLIGLCFSLKISWRAERPSANCLEYPLISKGLVKLTASYPQTYPQIFGISRHANLPGLGSYRRRGSGPIQTSGHAGLWSLPAPPGCRRWRIVGQSETKEHNPSTGSTDLRVVARG